MKREAIMRNDSVDRLLVKATTGHKGKPDQLKRWVVQVIERMRVAERTTLIVLRLPPGQTDEEALAIWDDAEQEAISQLRKEGKIRTPDPIGFPETGNGRC